MKTFLSVSKLGLLLVTACIYGFTNVPEHIGTRSIISNSDKPSSIRLSTNAVKIDEQVSMLRKYVVKDNATTSFRQAVDIYTRKAWDADGNILAEGYFERGKGNIIWIIERWASDSLANKFWNGDAGKALLKAMRIAKATSDEVIEVKDLEPIAKATWRKQPNTTDSAFTAMLFVNAKPGTGAEFKKRYHIAMPKFRSEAGVVTYQLSQIKGSDTRFVTYEKFRGNGAFQYHLKFPPIEPIIQFLHNSIADPPFEKNLHSLIQFTPFTYKN